MFRQGKRYSTRFLEKLYEHNVRKVYTKIELLRWDETTMGQIDGIVTNGTYSVDGSSSIRRNVNLTLSVIDRDDKLVFEYLDLSKKIRLWAGLENFTDEHQEDEIIWFNLGSYVLIEPSYSHSTDELRMTLQAQDKMALMNGVIGGVFNTATSFTQRDSRTGYTHSLPWREIFYYAATIFGEEDPGKVVVESVPDFVKDYVQVKTIGGMLPDFIHVDADPEEQGVRIITDAWSPDTPGREMKFSQGDRLYKLRRFGPPDPQDTNTSSKESYMKNAGEPIDSVFKDIVEELGHTHEVFYNTNGDLILQKIKHYINDTFDPTVDPHLGYAKYEFDMDRFEPDFSGFPFAYDFSNKDSVTAYTNNPSWSNLKNDYIVIGKDGMNTLQIAIDKKPTIRELREWFKKFNEDFKENPSSADLEFLRLDLNGERMPYNEEEDSVPFLYKEPTKNSPAVYVDIPLNKIPWQIGLGLKNYMIRNIYSKIGQERVLPRWGKECESMIFAWRANANKDGLLANMGIFNPSLAPLGTPWLAGFKTASSAISVEDVESLDYNNPIFTQQGDPSFWMYFLELIDEDSKLGKFSIGNIGKRTTVVSSDLATSLFRVNPRSLVVLTEDELAKLGGDIILKNLKEERQPYIVIRDETYQMFRPSYYTIEETRTLFPFQFIYGDPFKNEQQFLVDDSLQSKYVVGGFYSGQILRNTKADGTEVNGYIGIGDGNFRHPITKEVFHNQSATARYSELYIPLDESSQWNHDPKNLASLQNMFVCYIRNKGGRMPDASGNDKLFAVCKYIMGSGWYYLAKIGEDNYKWEGFGFDTTEGGDVIVAFIEHRISEYESGEEISYISSGTIDNVYNLLNVRESGLVSLFDYTGNVDCLSILRKEMYLHTNFAEVITLTCLPIYHLEPNTLIRVRDKRTNIDGVYLMTSYNIPFDTSGGNLMSINAIKVNSLI